MCVCFVFWLLFSFDLRRSRYICFTTGPAEVEWEGNIAAALEAIWFYNLVFLRFYTCHYCPADSVTSCRSCGLSVSSFQFVRVTVVLLTPCHCVGATADLQGWQEIQTPLRRSIHVWSSRVSQKEIDRQEGTKELLFSSSTLYFVLIHTYSVFFNRN